MTTLKMAVVAPMPSAKVSDGGGEEAGRAAERAPRRTSRRGWSIRARRRFAPPRPRPGLRRRRPVRSARAVAPRRPPRRARGGVSASVSTQSASSSSRSRRTRPAAEQRPHQLTRAMPEAHGRSARDRGPGRPPTRCGPTARALSRAAGGRPPSTCTRARGGPASDSCHLPRIQPSCSSRCSAGKERAGSDGERAVRHLANAIGDGDPVQRLQLEGSQDQQIQRALQHVRARRFRLSRSSSRVAPPGTGFAG